MAGILFHIPDSTIGGIDSYTKLMLHMDDVGLTDSSLYTKTITAQGSVVRSAAQSKFGGYSAYVNAGHLWVGAEYDPDYEFGTGDFTIDMWIRPSGGVVGIQYTFVQVGLAAVGLGLSGTDLFLGAGPPWSTTTRTYSFAINTWYHVAMVGINGDTIRGFVNGQQIGGDFSISYNIEPGPGGGRTFVAGDSNPYIGYLDELRISKGIARWTTNFTPETGPYTI